MNSHPNDALAGTYDIIYLVIWEKRGSIQTLFILGNLASCADECGHLLVALTVTVIHEPNAGYFSIM